MRGWTCSSQRIADLDTIVTANENEALILEANLIKRHRPPFNIELKDDKRYPYLKVSLYHRFPGLFLTRKIVRGRIALLRSLHPREGLAADAEDPAQGLPACGTAPTAASIARSGSVSSTSSSVARPRARSGSSERPTPPRSAVSFDSWRGTSRRVVEELRAQMLAAAAALAVRGIGAAARRHRDPRADRAATANDARPSPRTPTSIGVVARGGTRMLRHAARPRGEGPRKGNAADVAGRGDLGRPRSFAP